MGLQCCVVKGSRRACAMPDNLSSCESCWQIARLHGPRERKHLAQARSRENSVGLARTSTLSSISRTQTFPKCCCEVVCALRAPPHAEPNRTDAPSAPPQVPQVNKAYVQRALMDENVQYLFLALFWSFTTPILCEYIFLSNPRPRPPQARDARNPRCMQRLTDHSSSIPQSPLFPTRRFRCFTY